MTKRDFAEAWAALQQKLGPGKLTFRHEPARPSNAVIFDQQLKDFVRRVGTNPLTWQHEPAQGFSDL